MNTGYKHKSTCITLIGVFYFYCLAKSKGTFCLNLAATHRYLQGVSTVFWYQPAMCFSWPHARHVVVGLLRLLYIFRIYWFACLFVYVSKLITCTVITSHTLLLCHAYFTLINLMAALSMYWYGVGVDS